jgi:hypothetical protein
MLLLAHSQDRYQPPGLWWQMRRPIRCVNQPAARHRRHVSFEGQGKVTARKRELHDVIEGCHQGVVPLLVPITLIKHYVGLFEIPYLQQQVYLNPHPKALMLQNHV